MVNIHLLHHRAKEKKEAWRAFPLLSCVSHLLDYELCWLDELHNSKDDGTAEEPGESLSQLPGSIVIGSLASLDHILTFSPRLLHVTCLMVSDMRLLLNR